MRIRPMCLQPGFARRSRFEFLVPLLCVLTLPVFAHDVWVLRGLAYFSTCERPTPVWTADAILHNPGASDATIMVREITNTGHYNHDTIVVPPHGSARSETPRKIPRWSRQTSGYCISTCRTRSS